MNTCRITSYNVCYTKLLRTSDHEVNLKILLGIITAKGLLKDDEARTLLGSLTEQVVNMVLWNNYAQSLAISRDERRSRLYLHDFITAIEILDTEVAAFNRRDFFIPKNENLSEIVTKERNNFV